MPASAGVRVGSLHATGPAHAGTTVRALAAEYPAERSLELPWPAIEAADPSLADELLRTPQLTLGRFTEALHALAADLEDVDTALADAQVRVTDLPERATLTVGAERVGDVERLRAFEGQITKRTEVLPKIEEAAFQCHRCGTLTRVPQGFGALQEPRFCEACEAEQPGWQLHTDQSKWVDYQKVRLQQPPEDAVDGATSYLDVHLTDDLVATLEGGQRATITGRYVPVPTGRTIYDKRVHGVAVAVDDGGPDADLLDAHREAIRELEAADDTIDRLVAAFAPGHRGNAHVKEAIVLQLFAGWPRTAPDGTYHRGDSHILLVGDPGVGKTILLQAAAAVAPRSVVTDGTGSSGAGLTAALTKDDFADGQQWSIEAGSIVRANEGLCAVDELDKGDAADLETLHTALESQEVLVSKAGRHAHLPAKAALLAAGNPTGGHFDPGRAFAAQVQLQSPLLSRFDLIFVLRERHQEGRVREVADHIVRARQIAGKIERGESVSAEEREVVASTVPTEQLAAYVAYQRRERRPVIRDPALARRLREWFVDLKTSLPNRYVDDDGPPLPVTARALDGAQRLAEASARARGSDTVGETDVERAERLVTRSLADIGIQQGADASLGRVDPEVDAGDLGLE